MARNRTVLITGCSDGSLGSQLSLALRNEGWRVFASARNLAKLSVVTAAGIETLQLDVRSDESIAAAVTAVKELTGGSLDALINNAGIGLSLPLLDIDLDRMRDVYDLNVFSILRVSKAFVPLLLESKNRPLLVNNTSGAGLLGCGSPFESGYASSKAAAASLTDGLRIELSPFNIRVINLVTGGVKSTIFDNTMRDGRVKLPPDSLYLLAKDDMEGPMNGDRPLEKREDAEVWARNIAKDLSQLKPPHKIYRGAQAGTAKWATMLPSGTVDHILKHGTGFEEFERKLKERDGKK